MSVLIPERPQVATILDADPAEFGHWEQGGLILETAEERRARLLERIEENLRLGRERPDIRAYTRNKHYVGARPAAATAATARAVAINLWNPHATSRIELFEIWIANTAATAFNISMARTTARGTASTTVSMAIANAILNDTAAPSAFVIDTAWSVAATVSSADMIRWNVPATVGAGVILPFPDPIEIPPGTGIALIAATALAYQIADHTFVVGD